MAEIICYTSHLPEGTKQNITFMELLLDDRWADGKIVCPLEVFSKAGDINHRLSAKQNYEFLLRAIQSDMVTAVGCHMHPETLSQSKTLLPSVPADAMLLKEQEPPADAWNSYRSDCYIAGKYQQKLLDAGVFNPVMEVLLGESSRLPNPEEAVAWLEKMISHGPEYFTIDDDTQPILIYRGSDTCYNTLNLFADQLAKSFLSCRQRVVVFDPEKEGNQALTKFIGCRFKGIIGIQSYVFSIKMQDKKTCLHDLIHGPKYNMILDHPAWLKEHIENGPKDYYLLIHDRNYMSFAERYFKNVKGVFYFPPGGIMADAMNVFSERPYDITFIGSYYDYRDRLDTIHRLPRPKRILAARFLQIMRRTPDCPAEYALRQALEYYHLTTTDEEFPGLFFEMRLSCFCIMHYYREKIIRTLLDSGIKIHVYGETWKNAPFAGNECLICHPALTAEESLEIMAQSKISLNIMSWHKDGLTERVLNAMLAGSVVLSDRSSALEESFIDGQDMLLFSLEKLDELPALVKGILADEEKIRRIAENGFEKARNSHQWLDRGKQFLWLLPESRLRL